MSLEQGRPGRRARRSITALLAATAVLALTLVWAPSASAAPRMTVSQTTNLEDGQTITVSGVGFTPNLKGIAVGQCKTGYTGPNDCNLAGGATFRNADATGSIGTVTLKVATSFGGTDCTKIKCVIAAAPLPNSSTPEEIKANTVIIPITFGAPPAPEAPQPSATPTPETPQASETPESTTPESPTDTTTDAATSAPSAGSDLPHTGPTDAIPVVVLGGTALLLSGLGLTLLLPMRRRHGGPA